MLTGATAKADERQPDLGAGQRRPILSGNPRQPAHHGWLTRRRRRALWGLVFVSPWLVGLFGLVLYPMGLSLYYSFTNYDIVGPSTFVGLSNYHQLFDDPEFRQALGNTLYLVVVMVPLSLLVSLGYTLLLNLPVYGQRVFRTVLYLPQMVPTVASAILWLWVLNPKYGLVNTILGWFHILGPLWLNSIDWSKPALVLMNIWGIGGAAIIFLAGLQGISPGAHRRREGGRRRLVAPVPARHAAGHLAVVCFSMRSSASWRQCSTSRRPSSWAAATRAAIP